MTKSVGNYPGGNYPGHRHIVYLFKYGHAIDHVIRIAILRPVISFCIFKKKSEKLLKRQGQEISLSKYAIQQPCNRNSIGQIQIFSASRKDLSNFETADEYSYNISHFNPI